ncbi:DUF1904 family protein [Bacillus sp. JCM 19041]|uniref:DUF1904 family protein n=1 Tax=Bacillus sp. JCM 19041 TaxID=1460637 RepID=UPI0006D1AF10
MPYLRFSGFPKQELQQLAPAIIDAFSSIVNIPKRKVKIERIQSEEIANCPLTVEILMFQRDQSIHDAIAHDLNHLLEECGYTNIHIFFVILSPSLYYKQGKAIE